MKRTGVQINKNINTENIIGLTSYIIYHSFDFKVL